VTALLLLRHAQSEWNEAGRWQGQADPPLSAAGMRQADLAATRVARCPAVWASDLRRARATAERMSARWRLAVRVDARLRERAAGAWEGLTRAEIEGGWPGYLADGHRPEGWEPDAAVVERSYRALRDIAGSSGDGPVLVVTHGGVIRNLEHHLAPDDPRSALLLPNLSGLWITIEDSAMTLGERVTLLTEDETTVPGQI
jgi:broad specificity phosphatase PhoE